MNSDEEQTQNAIVEAVDGSIMEQLQLYKREPTRFFTENDLVCCLYRLLSNSLEKLNLATSPDRDGFLHSLIHCEYPTPFRCDMKHGFRLKTDDDRTLSGNKFRRGHYDIVILNPAFVSQHSYPAIKCQNYAEFLRSPNSMRAQSESIVLYGIELNFSRDIIKKSRGSDWKRAARAFIADVAQDSDKLAAGLNHPGFMANAVMLAFTKGTTGEVIKQIQKGIQNVPLARLVVAEEEF